MRFASSAGDSTASRSDLVLHIEPFGADEEGMDWITKADWDRFDATALEPYAEPRYEQLKGCLIWPDEHVDGLSRGGIELLGDLFVARSLLHRSVAIASWPGGSDALQQRWDAAIAAALPWNGFVRVELTDAQQTFLVAEARQSLLAGA